MLECGAEPQPRRSARPAAAGHRLRRFRKADLRGLDGEGTAFGTGPIETKAIPGYQGDVGGHGDRVVNSHATAPGDSVDGRTRPRHADQQAVHDRAQLHQLPDRRRQPHRQDLHEPAGRRQDRALGHRPDDNRMKPQGWAVRRWAGKTARLSSSTPRPARGATSASTRSSSATSPPPNRPAAGGARLRHDGAGAARSATEPTSAIATCRRSKPLDAILRRPAVTRTSARDQTLSDKLVRLAGSHVLPWLPANRPS